MNVQTKNTLAGGEVSAFIIPRWHI